MTRRILQLLTGAIAAAAIIYVSAGVGLTQEREDHESGAYLYRVFCVVCHGDDGKGHGPASDTLRQTVPDLTVLSRAAGGVFPRNQVLRALEVGGPTAAHVPGAMPTWSEAFARLEPSKGTAQKRLQVLVDHIETLQAKE